MQRLSLLACVVVLAGCYSLHPVGTAATEGTQVAFDLNDAGRAAMADRIGPEILQMEGRLVSDQNGDYVLSVRSVRFLRGGEQVWAGERVTISKSHVGTTYERRLSKGRTAALTTAIVVGGAVAVLVGKPLIAGSEPGPGGKGGDGDGNQLIWPPAIIKP